MGRWTLPQLHNMKTLFDEWVATMLSYWWCVLRRWSGKRYDSHGWLRGRGRWWRSRGEMEDGATGTREVPRWTQGSRSLFCVAKWHIFPYQTGPTKACDMDRNVEMMEKFWFDKRNFYFCCLQLNQSIRRKAACCWHAESYLANYKTDHAGISLNGR